MQQGAVVREQQEAGRVLVQPPDRGDDWIAGAPTGRQQLVDQRPGFLVGTGDADRLVQHQGHAGRRIEPRPVHPHALGQVLGDGETHVGVGHRRTVERHETGAHDRLNLAARSVTHVRQQPVEP